MALINPKKKEVQTKLVYYGPGRGGKTSNLKYIFDRYQNRINGKLTSINTHGDRTLFFDFLPLDAGTVKGYNVKLQFYTVPGQVKYKATRKLVLRGVDGIVFVADSMVLRQQSNIASLEDLKENLAEFNKDIFNIPIVFQFNKRDLIDEQIPILPLHTLKSDLNGKLNAPFFEASALKGTNVVETMKTAISLTVASLQDRL